MRALHLSNVVQLGIDAWISVSVLLPDIARHIILLYMDGRASVFSREIFKLRLKYSFVNINLVLSHIVQLATTVALAEASTWHSF